MNALMAVQWLKYSEPIEAIALALASFKGVKRRFSYQIKKRSLVYIDDYASSNRD
jgi:UDP-N-acetylmuramate--alanine ligase